MRKCKTCGAIAFLGYSDPLRRETWLAPACDVHHAQIERGWLQWCSDNGRNILPVELRHPDNRGIDFSARQDSDKPKPARPVSAPARDPEQKGFDL